MAACPACGLSLEIAEPALRMAAARVRNRRPRSRVRARGEGRHRPIRNPASRVITPLEVPIGLRSGRPPGERRRRARHESAAACARVGKLLKGRVKVAWPHPRRCDRSWLMPSQYEASAASRACSNVVRNAESDSSASAYPSLRNSTTPIAAGRHRQSGISVSAATCS